MVDWDGERYAEVSGLQRMVAEEAITGLALAGDERATPRRRMWGGRLHHDAAGRTIARRLGGRGGRRLAPDDRACPGPGAVRHAARPVPRRRRAGAAVRPRLRHRGLLQRPPLGPRSGGEALRQIGRSLVGGGRAVLQMVCATERPRASRTWRCRSRPIRVGPPPHSTDSAHRTFTSNRPISATSPRRPASPSTTCR